MTLKEILQESPYPEIGIFYEDLPSEEDPVQVSCCGNLVDPSNAYPVYDGGTVCLDCFCESTELIRCGWCSVVLTQADLVRFRDCPACGYEFGEKK